jgi:hypothetical protein
MARTRRTLALLLAAGALSCSNPPEQYAAESATHPHPAGPSMVALVGAVTTAAGAPVPGARLLLVATGRTPGPELPAEGICDGPEVAWNEARTDSSGNYFAFLRSATGGPVCYAVVVDPPAGMGRRTVFGGVPGVMADESGAETRIDVVVLEGE